MIVSPKAIVSLIEYQYRRLDLATAGKHTSNESTPVQARDLSGAGPEGTLLDPGYETLGSLSHCLTVMAASKQLMRELCFSVKF